MTIALFPGRFQPFHKGHRCCVEQIIEAGRQVIIGIRDDVPMAADNPFTVSQRYDIIRQAIGDLDCMIVALPTQLQFDEVWTNNPDLITMFDGYEIIRRDPISGFSATQIRERLCNEQAIDDLVCSGTARMIEQYFAMRAAVI